jgi:arabinofuranosyltransferase
MTKKNNYIVFILILVVFLFVLIRTAWISDDAAITLRTVLNFLNGYGPRFNIDERVQAYTHPLWFLVISAFSIVIKNVFYTTFVLSIGISLLTVWILFTRLATNIYGAIAAGLIFVLSKAFVDFSTSGLENPLSHLLIVSVVILALNAKNISRFKNLALFFLSCSLLYLSRPDLLVLIFPLSILVLSKYRHTPSTALKAIFVGMSPWLIWTLFSLYYYGVPFPNTAYAKLATGIPFIERATQGLHYLEHSLYTDPLTIICISLGIIVGFSANSVGVSLACGVLLYLAYIVSIGGDFMEGRFLTAPLLLSAIQISRYQFSKIYLYILLSLIVCLGLFSIGSTLLSNESYSNTRFAQYGIADERGYYFQHLGLLTAQKQTYSMPDWTTRDRKVDIACGGLGFKGIFAGPSTHFIDVCALSDPLLARTPTLSTPLRVGHYERALPPGYVESVVNDQNLIQDEKIASVYSSIRSVTRDALNDARRLKEIILINFGKHPKPDFSKYRYRMNVDEVVLFKTGSKGSLFLKDNGESEFRTSGWATAESWGTWSLGTIARLRLAVPSKEKPTALVLNGQVLLSPKTNQQRIEVFVVRGTSYENGEQTLIQSLLLTGEGSNPALPLQIVIPIEKQELESGFINLEFKFPTPVQPKDFSVTPPSLDERELTLGLISAVYK